LNAILVVTWIARSGEEIEIERILHAMVSHTRAETGCLGYEVLRSVENPRRFVLFETYTNEAALRAHTESAHFKHFVLEEAVPRLESRERVRCTRLAE
jgi:(4S)-4-hydroxy-5-phosphonooxypentane-2,3-dione isomerase